MSHRAVRGIGILVLAAIACGPKEAPQTGDESRSAALEILPGTTVDDKIDKAKDPVDCKRFTVEDKTPATVNIYFDNPSVGAEVTLRDMFGGAVGMVKHQAAADKDSIANVILKDGTYFLEIAATKGASVYTIEVMLGNDSGSLGIPRPE